MAGGGATWTREDTGLTGAQQAAVTRLVHREVADPDARQDVLEALGLAPYSDPKAAGYRALAAAIAGPDEERTEQ
ncbi:hypothetical protein BL253_01070 [Pseudofrankia asymbiotica]|uniref:Uncharacterized protein n=1 Tax=Pseudofrankia asymbiotica TaxID=1834516 RepID=A0A1V2IKX6_9ACTN|nr:hypothetical protein BL253_01070 [Pseudofrankia asymbiotica]